MVAGPTELTWEAVAGAEARFLDQMLSDHDIAGILIWYIGGHRNIGRLQAVRQAGIPMIFIDRAPPRGFDADHVGVDNRYAAERVVRHLIAVGHRNIAHVTNLDQASTVADRMAGYRAALKAAGLPFRPEYVFQETEAAPNDGADVCLAIADRALGLAEPPTAFFAVNDQLALRLIYALQARGVRVPEDIAVAGFDGVERWSHGATTLTTALQPFRRIGSHAVDLLLLRIEDPTESAYRYVLLDAPLSVQGSTRAGRRDRPADDLASKGEEG